MHMRRHLLSLLLLPCLLCSCLAKKEEEICLYLTDYGAVADDPNHDNAPALLSLLAEVRKAVGQGKKVIISLPRGNVHIYSSALEVHSLYISNHDHHQTRKVAWMLDGLKNVKVRGEDTHLQFHGTLIPMVVRGCEGIELEGFTIDYPRPTMTQIEIKEVDKDSGKVLVDLLEETHYEVRNQQLFILTETDTVAVPWTLPFGKDGHMKWNRSDPLFNPEKIEEVAPHRLLLTGWNEIDYLKEGDIYVLRSPNRPTPGMVISNSTSIWIENVTIHFADGMGLLAQSSTDIYLKDFSVARGEGSKRRFTTVADATHFSGCRGGVVSVGGVYENMADDAINVHGTYLQVDSIVGGKELYASFAHYQTYGIPWYEEGDTLGLVSRSTLMSLSTFVPSRVEVLSPKRIRVILPEPIDEIGALVALENVSAYPSVLFSRNVIRNNRARGALFTTRRSVKCEGNCFDHTHGSAILLTGDANGWFESGPCEEVLIAGNHFLNALTSRYQFTEGIISIAPQIAETPKDAYYHGRVRIENNRFDNYDVPLIFAHSVRCLIIRDNEYRRNEDYPPLFDRTTSKCKEIGVLESEINIEQE